MHPYYYDCPLDFLEEVPVSCEEWRAGVKAFHEDKKQTAAKIKKITLGDKITLNNATIPYVVVSQIKPLRGIFENKVYRIPKKFIGEIEYNVKES